MKPTGKHPDKRLTAAGVNAAKKPGRYADGNCLYLTVDPSGAKRWLLRINVHGKRKDIGLGSVRLVSLKEAREKAADYRKIARNGGDPLAEKRKAQQVIPTFAEAADQVHGENLGSWKNAKHAAQWINTLRTYAFPVFGDRSVEKIDTPAVLKVLSPIWLKKPQTARRVKQRIGTVLDWASAAGFRDGENPINGVAKGLPRQPDKKAHHKAMAQFLSIFCISFAFNAMVMTVTTEWLHLQYLLGQVISTGLVFLRNFGAHRRWTDRDPVA